MTTGASGLRSASPACGAVLLAASVLAGESALQEDSATIDRTPMHTVVPKYPEKARAQRIEGEVQVCFYIDRAGNPYRIAVRKSTHRIFERPSIRAVKASAYVPLARGEKLPAIKSCRTFRFALDPAGEH
jgi:TonB family protein